MLMARYMSPNDPDPIFLTSLYFPPTMNSVFEPLLLAIMSTKWQFPLGSPSEMNSKRGKPVGEYWILFESRKRIPWQTYKMRWLNSAANRFFLKMSLNAVQEIEQLNADTYKGFHKKNHPDKCRIRVQVCLRNVYINVNIPPQTQN